MADERDRISLCVSNKWEQQLEDRRSWVCKGVESTKEMSEGKRKGRTDRNTALMSKIRRYIFLKNTYKEIEGGRDCYKHILLLS